MGQREWGGKCPACAKSDNRGISKPAQFAEMGQTLVVLEDPSWGMMADWGRPRSVLRVGKRVISIPLFALAIKGGHLQIGLVLAVGNVLAGVVGG